MTDGDFEKNMIRKLKVAAALMAVMALTAVMASGAQASFTASSYPALVTATSTADVFDAFGTSTKCTNNSFSGTLSAASNDLTLTPNYTTCEAFAGLPVTVETTGCVFTFTAPTTPASSPATALLHIVCPAGATGIHFRMSSSSSHTTEVCRVSLPPQTANFPVSRGAGDVVLSGSITPLTTTQVRNAFLCPAGTHTLSGNYTIQPAGITFSSAGKTITYD